MGWLDDKKGQDAVNLWTRLSQIGNSEAFTSEGMVGLCCCLRVCHFHQLGVERTQRGR